ncbi:MAG: serine/threonine-protein kinase [Deltaproteobacteria bacterium]
MLEAGQRIGRYTLEACIGSGGFGAVWSARDDDGREVALKVLHKQLVDDVPLVKGPTVTERFLQEARLIARLDHPGLVRIHDVIDEGGYVAYAMERLHGCDLSKLLGEVPLDTVLHLFAEVADTLTFLHDNGVIHRDVKPQNIFATPSGAAFPGGCRVKLLDFGAAKELNATTRLDATGTGVLIGTLRAMAPEAFKSSRVTEAVDQWGLGVALNFALTGRVPFEAPGLMDLLRQIEEDPVPPVVLAPHFGRPRCPPALEAIVQRCLAKAPEKRYPSVQHVAIELRAVASRLAEDSTEKNPLPADGDLARTSALRLGELVTRHLAPGRLAIPEAVTDPAGFSDELAVQGRRTVRLAPKLPTATLPGDDLLGGDEPTTRAAAPGHDGTHDDTLDAPPMAPTKAIDPRRVRTTVAPPEPAPKRRWGVLMLYVVALIVAIGFGWFLRGV